MGTLHKIITCLILLIVSERSMGQKNLFHLTYKPVSCTLIDTTWAYDQYDEDDHSADLAGFDSLEVFITRKYCVAISHSAHRRVHEVYNRKTKIIRRLIQYDNKDYFIEDSVMYYLHKDKKLREKAYNLKDSLSIQYAQVQKNIHGKKCHLITRPAYGWFTYQRDSFWVANYKDIPMMVKGGWWISGVPFEFVVNDGLVSVRVESRITPVPDLPIDVFTIDPGMNELRQLQSHLTLDNFMELFLRYMP